MKKILCICVLVFSVSNAYGQEHTHKNSNPFIPSNSVKILFTDFYSRGTSHDRIPLSEIRCTQQGLHYERRIFNDFFIGVGYTQWYNLNWDNIVRGDNSFPAFLSTLSQNEYQNYKPIIGRLEARFKYKMVDVYVIHKFSIKKSRHLVSPGIGASYSWGQDQYLAWHYYYGFESHGGYEYRKAHYYGFIPSLSYDYLLWKNRLNVGADIRVRYYSGRPEAQYDYGIHVGVNF